MIKKGKEIPIVSIVAKSGTGKTTLIEKLIPALIKRGYRVGTIKHHGHGFEIDHEGKDSWRHKQAGAQVTVLASSHRVAVVEEVEKDHAIEELRDIYIRGVDIVLTEGFKKNRLPKIEVFRADLEADIISRGDETLVAVVGDKVQDINVPWFSSQDIDGVVDLIESRFLAGK